MILKDSTIQFMHYGDMSRWYYYEEHGEQLSVFFYWWKRGMRRNRGVTACKWDAGEASKHLNRNLNGQINFEFH
jgi:hypothetical protein